LLVSCPDIIHQPAKYLKAIKSPFAKGIFGAYHVKSFKYFATGKRDDDAKYLTRVLPILFEIL